MKAVMISINPKWCEKIASGEKTIEVRKTRPNIDTPFKCYIYCTKDFKFNDFKYSLNFLEAYKRSGKVIGEFVCDNIGDFSQWEFDYFALLRHINLFAGTNHDYKFLDDYLKGQKKGYAWHISDLVIYDEPRELGEFWAYNAELNKQFNRGEDYCAWGRCETENGCTNDCDTENILNCYQCWADWNGWCHRLTRPPESWRYIDV